MTAERQQGLLKQEGVAAWRRQCRVLRQMPETRHEHATGVLDCLLESLRKIVRTTRADNSDQLGTDEPICIQEGIPMFRDL